MEVQAPTSSSLSQATDMTTSAQKFDAMSFATRMSSFDQTCSCCPYGYHIDLDFLRYLDSLYSSDTLKKLKKVRCSKDGSLPRGVEPPQQAPHVNLTSPTYTSTASDNLVTCATSRRGGKEVLVELDISPSHERSTIQSSPESRTIAVSPNSDSKFRTETEIFISNSSDVDTSENRESLISSIEQRFDMSRSTRTESYSKRTLETSVPQRPVHLTLTQPNDPTSAMPYRPFSRGSSSSPVDSEASSGISPAVLQAIREQMALSLRRMKELEEQVKVIPVLQARISMLVRENEHLTQSVRSSEVSSQVGARVGQRLVDAWTQTEESLRSSVDFGTQGRREVDLNSNRVSEENVGVVEMVEVSSAVEQNRTKSQEAKYYSVAIQCQLLTDDPKFEGGFKGEMTSVAVEVRPSVISRCVGTDNGFLWYPADNRASDVSMGDSGATYEQRLAWWMKLGVDKATSIDEPLANYLEFRLSEERAREHAMSRAVPSVTVDRVQLATAQTFSGESKVLGEAATIKDNTVPQRNADFKRRLDEDSGEDSAGEETSEFSDRSFEFETAVTKAETSFSQSDYHSRQSTVKTEGAECADSADEDVLVEKAVGGYDKLSLEQEIGSTEESVVTLTMDHFFGTAEDIWLEEGSDGSGKRDSLGVEMSRAVALEDISDTGEEAETKDQSISDTGKEAETKDEGISDAGKEDETKDEGISDAGKEDENQDEEISDASVKARNKETASIDLHAAFKTKDEGVLGEDEESEIKLEDEANSEAVGNETQGIKSEEEFVLIRDFRAPMMESKRGTMSLETNLEVLLEQEAEKEEELEISGEMSLEKKEQKQDVQGDSEVLDVDLMNSDVVSVVMNAQAMAVNEETVIFNQKAGIEDEGISDAGKEGEYEDEGISDTGKKAEAKNEDISDADKEAVKVSEEISATGEEAKNKDTEIKDLHTVVKSKDKVVLGEDREAEIKAENEDTANSEAVDKENQFKETESEDKSLLDKETKSQETEEAACREVFLNEGTDSDKEGGDDIFDSDSDMTRTDEESGGSYEIDWVTKADETMVTIETRQGNNSNTSMIKRNELAFLVEEQEETVAPERDSAETPKSDDVKAIGEAVVAIDTRGETIETEVTRTKEVTKNCDIGELGLERDTIVESVTVGESSLKSFEIVTNTDIQSVQVEEEWRVQASSGVDGTSRSLVAGEERVAVGKDLEEKESEVRQSDEKESEAKESEVKESEGKEPEVRKSEGKECEVRESEEKEPEVKESEGKESEVKETEGKESEVRESEGKESEVMVSEVKESEERESEVMESEGKESEVTETEGKECEVRESEGKESEVKESEERESEVMESEGKESEVTETEGKECEVRESEGKESEVKETEGKESEVWESEGKESEVRESEVKESEERESEVMESEGKESEVTETEGKECEVRESEVMESEGKESEVTETEGKECEVRESEGKESEVKESEGKESEVKESEGKESEVRESERKESEVRETEGKESEVRESERKESEVKESEERESEVMESEGKESEVRESEGKESEVRESEGKESEVRESEGKESEVKETEGKECEVRESEGKESEVKESEGKESEVKESEGKESEVRESERKESEVRESVGKESEVRESERNESEVRESEVKESEDRVSEEWEVVEKVLDVREWNSEESEMWKSQEKESEASSEKEIERVEFDGKEPKTRESDTKESEEWELVDKESDQRDLSEEESEVGKSYQTGSNKPIESPCTSDSLLPNLAPSIDHIEIISLSDSCHDRHESIIVSKTELCQLVKTEPDSRNSSGDTVDQLSREPVCELLDTGSELVKDFPQREEISECAVLCENVEQTRSKLIEDRLEQVDKKMTNEEIEQSMEPDGSIEQDKNVLDTSVEPEKSMALDTSVEPDKNVVPCTSVEPDKNIELDRGVEPDRNIMLNTSLEPDTNTVPHTRVEPVENIVLDTSVEPEKSTMSNTSNEPVKNIVSCISVEQDNNMELYRSMVPDQHAMPSDSTEPAETKDRKQAETTETFNERSQLESSDIRDDLSENQSRDFCTVESASTSTKRVVISETRIERRRTDQHGSSQGSGAIDSGELQKGGPPGGNTEELTAVETTSVSSIPSTESQSVDDSPKMVDQFVVRPDVLAACAVYAEYLRDPTVAVDSDNVVSCVDFLRNHWFDLSGRKVSHASLVQFHVDEYQTFGTSLAQNIINMADSDGNTAMHYAVSYGNMEVIAVLLNTGFCNVDKQNKAGYTAIMLASLLLVDLNQHEPLVLRLFHSGDVNSTSATSGQTSLMLAASHSRSEMVALLLEAGAEINLQDEDGSTALMCASEHGHSEVIQTLLSHPDCDSTITDVDGSTALSIAMEEGHHDIGVFLYAHMKAIDDRLLEED